MQATLERKGTEVWLINGAGVTTTSVSTQSFTASEDLIQGEVIFVSGVWAVPATAASGASNPEYYPVGLTSEGAFQNATVQVVLDDVFNQLVVPFSFLVVAVRSLIV